MHNKNQIIFIYKVFIFCQLIYLLFHQVFCRCRRSNIRYHPLYLKKSINGYIILMCQFSSRSKTIILAYWQFNYRDEIDQFRLLQIFFTSVVHYFMLISLSFFKHLYLYCMTGFTYGLEVKLQLVRANFLGWEVVLCKFLLSHFEQVAMWIIDSHKIFPR